MQELESRFNEAYSHSLSMKDERIQVLERRMEDLVSDTEQLKDEASLLRRQNERLQRKSTASGSPNTSFRSAPSHTSGYCVCVLYWPCYTLYLPRLAVLCFG